MPSYSITQKATREYFFEHDEENENLKRMAIDNSRNLFVSNGVETQKFTAGQGHGFLQFDFDLDQPSTCLADCTYIGEIYFGLQDGNVAVCFLGRVEEIITFPFDTPVTAIYCKSSATVRLCYVAHGQHVSLIRISGSERTILPSQHTVEGDNPITLLRSYNNVLYCFARNRIFLYNEQTGQQDSIRNYDAANESVLCVFEHPEIDIVYMVYPNGIYAIEDADANTFREINIYANTITSACHFSDFFAMSTVSNTIFVFKFTNRGFIRVAYDLLSNVTTLNVNQAYLCAPREGNEFNLITRNWLIRFSIEEGDSSSEEESEHFSDEDSESSDSSESEGEEEPAHDASGGGPAVGSKRRQLLDKDDPAFERKRKVMLQRALQFLTEEERQVILNAPQELLNEIREEECAVCMQPLNREGVRAITSECDHVMCEPCERIVVRRDPRCPTCREPWERATLEMLLLV